MSKLIDREIRDIVDYYMEGFDGAESIQITTKTLRQNATAIAANGWRAACQAIQDWMLGKDKSQWPGFKDFGEQDNLDE